ncbi:hypothetical protein RRG08_041636 [Elysia crispata]|uniref:Uncharacterized protein n=1 Tax=Elysia crispata TaxID=231223 RepID=A0AAE0XNR9_9GAST|nr:hypothetical protein RRG08_041636 [Elysia crispata]
MWSTSLCKELTNLVTLEINRESSSKSKLSFSQSRHHNLSNYSNPQGFHLEKQHHLSVTFNRSTISYICNL